MGLIDRALINKEILIKTAHPENDDFLTCNYSQLISFINRAKTYLLKQKRCRPGEKVLMSINGWPQYVAWWTAVAELGMSFVVSDYPYINSANSVGEKLDLYGDIGYLIGDADSKEFAYWPEKIKNKFIDKNVIFSNIDESNGNVFLNRETDIMLYSASSGSTGRPKIIAHTQKFFYDLLHRNAKLYDLKEDDRCLHTKGLHHGSVTGVYFLPTLKYCKYHYHHIVSAGHTDNGKWVSVIKKEKINRCLMFYKMPYKFCEMHDKSGGYQVYENLTVYVLAKLTKNALATMAGRLNCRVFSVFGCSETSGPLFLPEINKENFRIFDENNFGAPLDDFYHIDINSDGRLSVTMPDGSVVDTGDMFTKNYTNFIFQGKENVYRVNGESFYLNVLNDEIEKITNLKNSIHYDLVFDQETEMVYMRANNDLSLSKLNNKLSKVIFDERYRVTKILVAKRQDFYSGIKFDAQEVRLRCRGTAKPL